MITGILKLLHSINVLNLIVIITCFIFIGTDYIKGADKTIMIFFGCMYLFVFRKTFIKSLRCIYQTTTEDKNKLLIKIKSSKYFCFFLDAIIVYSFLYYELISANPSPSSIVVYYAKAFSMNEYLIIVLKI